MRRTKALANPRFADLTERLVGARGGGKGGAQRLSSLTSPSNIPVPGTSPNAISERQRRRKIKRLTEKLAAEKAANNGYGGSDQGAGGSSYT